MMPMRSWHGAQKLSELPTVILSIDSPSETGPSLLPFALWTLLGL